MTGKDETANLFGALLKVLGLGASLAAFWGVFFYAPAQDREHFLRSGFSSPHKIPLVVQREAELFISATATHIVFLPELDPTNGKPNGGLDNGAGVEISITIDGNHCHSDDDTRPPGVVIPHGNTPLVATAICRKQSVPPGIYDVTIKANALGSCTDLEGTDSCVVKEISGSYALRSIPTFSVLFRNLGLTSQEP